MHKLIVYFQNIALCPILKNICHEKDNDNINYRHFRNIYA